MCTVAYASKYPLSAQVFMVNILVSASHHLALKPASRTPGLFASSKTFTVSKGTPSKRVACSYGLCMKASAVKINYKWG